VIDISAHYPTMRDLCETPDPAAALRAAHGEQLGTLEALLANTPPDHRDASKPWLIAPNDLQAIKAAGVTFVEADKAAFYNATKPIRDKYGSKYAALLKRIEDTK